MLAELDVENNFIRLVTDYLDCQSNSEHHLSLRCFTKDIVALSESQSINVLIKML